MFPLCLGGGSTSADVSRKIFRTEGTSAIEYKYFPIEEIFPEVYTKMAAAQKTFQDTWPTEEDFSQYSEVMGWRDLEKGIYKILGYRETRNNCGIALILQLRTKNSENVFEVWAPQRLGDKILEEHYDFVFNEGLAKSTKTEYFYFKFSLL